MSKEDEMGISEAQAMIEARRTLGWEPDEPFDITLVRSAEGHSGPGWYAWSTEYPDEGSVHIADDGKVSARRT